MTLKSIKSKKNKKIQELTTEILKNLTHNFVTISLIDRCMGINYKYQTKYLLRSSGDLIE